MSIHQYIYNWYSNHSTGSTVDPWLLHRMVSILSIIGFDNNKHCKYTMLAITLLAGGNVPRMKYNDRERVMIRMRSVINDLLMINYHGSIVTRVNMMSPLFPSADDMGVYLSHCTDSSSNFTICVTKEIIHEEDEWCVPTGVLREIYCYAFVLRHMLEKSRYISMFPRIYKIDLSKDLTRLTMENIPMNMHSIFHRTGTSYMFRIVSCIALARAVSSLHMCGIAHCDIKSGNLRFRSDGTPVLIDFDSCQFIASNCALNNLALNTTNISTNASTIFPVCTWTTRAPELLFIDQLTDSYDPVKLDVWSMTVVMIRILSSGCESVFGESTVQDTRAQVSTYIENKGKFKDIRKCMIIGEYGMRLANFALRPVPGERPSINTIIDFLQTCQHELQPAA